MFVHCNANIVDFREKAFSLFFFYALLISSAVQDRLWGLLAPWPLGVFRYRLFRLYPSIDCTSMLNLPTSAMCHPPPDQIMSTVTAAWNWKYRRSGDSDIRLYHSFLHGVLACLIAFRHVLEDADDFLAEVVGTENDNLTAVPQ